MIRGAVYLTTGHAIISILGVCVTILLTRFLGPGSYGTLALAYAYLGIYTTFSEASMNLVIIREARRRPNSLASYIVNGIMLQGVLALVGYLLANAILPLLGYTDTVTHLLRVGMLLLLLSPFALFRLVFIITQEIRLLAVLDLIGQLISLLLTLGVIWLQVAQEEAVLWMKFLSTFISLLLYFAYSRRLLPEGISLRPEFDMWRELLAASLPIFVTNCVSTLGFHAGRLVLGHLMSEFEVGLYTLATNLVASLGFLSAGYATLIYPRLSRFYVADRERFYRLYRLSFRTLMAIVLPLSALAAITNREIISLYAGSDFVQAGPLFSFLASMLGFRLGGTVLYYVMLASGRQAILSRVSALHTLVYLGCLVLLVPRFGLIGVALATLTMYIVAYTVYGILAATRDYVLAWLRSLVQPVLATLVLVGVVHALPLTPILVWLVGWGAYIGVWFLFIATDDSKAQVVHVFVFRGWHRLKEWI